jgi:hypothetical protein
MDTKIKKTKKQFDAIKTMREIRDKLSLEIMNMNYEQEREYLDKILLQGKSNLEKNTTR